MRTPEQIAGEMTEEYAGKRDDVILRRHSFERALVEAIEADREQRLLAAQEKVVELNGDIDHATKISREHDTFERGDNRPFMNLTWGSYDSGYRAALYEWVLNR